LKEDEGMAILVRAVRDNAGVPHNPGEEVIITGKTARSNSDATELIVVRFANNGYSGALVAGEVAEAGGLPVIGR
jgi:hypothetical protein